jgi:hypothetical protein
MQGGRRDNQKQKKQRDDYWGHHPVDQAKPGQETLLFLWRERKLLSVTAGCLLGAGDAKP